MLWLLPAIPLLAAAATAALPARASRAALAGWGAAASLVTLSVAVVAVDHGWSGTLAWSPQLELNARLDPVSALLIVLVPLIAGPVLVFAAFQEPRRGLRRLVALLLAFAGAMELLLIASDLLTLLLGWELVGACSWALIAHDWRQRSTVQDATVAFLVTRFGDLGLFVAAMATFAATGSFDYAALERLDGAVLHLAVAGLLLAAAVKSAQLPLAFWLFNAMSGPSAVSALLHAATMVAAGAYLIARLHPVLDQVSWFGPAAIGIGLTTALAGALVAILQSHAKKLLAASTSAHYGLMFVAAGAGYPALAVLHLLVHAAFKALLFLAAGAAADARGSHLLARLAAASPRLPVTAAVALVGVAALAGVPPLGGGWTKELVVTAAGHQGVAVAVLALVAGAASAVYGARWQWLIFGADAFSGVDRSRWRWRDIGPLLLAVLTVASALLWLPALHDAIDGWFGTTLPQTAAWERAATLLLLAVGLYLGVWLARSQPRLGESGRCALAADWLQLPALVTRGAARPVMALARASARFDDDVVDAAVRLLGDGGRHFSRWARLGDDTVVDAPARAAADLGRAMSGAGTAMAEAVIDGVAEGTARLLGASGADATRLQSGLAHHYLAALCAGAVLLSLVMLLS